MPHLVEAERHILQLQQEATLERLARQVQGPRLMRRRLGSLLIVAGQALLGGPACPPAASCEAATQ